MPSYLFDLGGSPVAVSPPAAPLPRKRRRSPAAHPSLIAWFETQVLLGLARQPREILCGLTRPQRLRRHACAKYIRRAQGKPYQLRIYMGGGRAVGMSWNVGLYPSEAAALQVRREWVRVAKAHPDPCEALAALKARGWVRPHVLPLCVVEVPGGYLGRRKTRDGVTETPTFATPEAARHAMKALVAEAACRQLPARHRADPVPSADAAGAAGPNSPTHFSHSNGQTFGKGDSVSSTA
jgi:hypothetical protein